MKVKVDSIIVLVDRHRKAFEDIDSLAQSIQEVGLIHPIVVERETMNLIAGERRLRAHKALGLEEIEVTFREDLDAWTAETIQLEENIKRQQLTWQEEVDAKTRLHERYQEKYGATSPGVKGGHRLKDTAALLGEAEGLTKMDVALGKAMRANPELAKKGTKDAAYKAMKSTEELSLRTQIAAILAEDSQEDERIQVVLGDSLEVLKGYPDNSFDFSITDPPWGVDVDSSVNLEEGWSEVRVDEGRSLEGQRLIFLELFRTLREGAHCYVFFASIMQEETRLMLEGCGFKVRRIPLVWHKTRSGNIDAAHRFTSCYEPIFFCHKGKPRIFNIPGMEDWFDCPTPSNKVHPTEKPTPLIASLIINASVEDEIGIDPFAGSGTFGVACRDLKRRAVLIEKDPEYYTRAWERVKGGKGDAIDDTNPTINLDEGGVS